MAYPHSLRGIEIRKGKYKTSIRIRFCYRGVLCKETLDLSDSKRDIAQAAYFRGEVLSAIARGSFSYEEFFPQSKNLARFRPVQKSMSIGDLLERYLANNEGALQPSTHEEYTKAVNTHLLPRWGNTQIKDLKKADLKEWIRSFECKKKSISNILTPLRGVVDEAMADELLDSNPFAAVNLKKLLRIEQKQSKFLADPFNIGEIKAILSACRDDSEYNYWKCAFASGMRPSEQMALEWKNVNFDVGKIYVEKKKVRGQTLDALKTARARRSIEMRLASYEALRSLSGEPKKHQKYVFIDERAGKPWQDTGALLRRFRLLCQKSDVRYRNPYQTRHTFASTLLASGNDQFYVATQMGHASVQVLFDRYARWIDQGASPHARAELDSFFSLWRPEYSEPPMIGIRAISNSAKSGTRDACKEC